MQRIEVTFQRVHNWWDKAWAGSQACLTPDSHTPQWYQNHPENGKYAAAAVLIPASDQESWIDWEANEAKFQAPCLPEAKVSICDFVFLEKTPQLREPQALQKPGSTSADK